VLDLIKLSAFILSLGVMQDAIHIQSFCFFLLLVDVQLLLVAIELDTEAVDDQLEVPDLFPLFLIDVLEATEASWSSQGNCLGVFHGTASMGVLETSIGLIRASGREEASVQAARLS
jgi:hypothetical protein